MKQVLLTVLLLGMVAPLIGQDLYLPATSKSKEAKALYTEAMDALYDVEFSKALKISKKALEADPNFFMGHFIQSYSGDKATRKAALDKLANYSGKMNKGEKVLKQMAAKMKADAQYVPIEEGRQLVKLYPKNVFAKVLLAYNLGNNKETRAEALSLLDECAKMAPELATIYNSKGYLYLANKEFDKAEKAFNKYIEMASDKANPYDSKGDYFMAIKNYEEAGEEYKKAHEMNADFKISMKKREEALWMAKREKLAAQVKEQLDKLVADYNSMDMAKYTKHYFNGPEFCYVLNGKTTESYNEFAKQVFEGQDKYKEWKVEILDETIQIPSENIAVVAQIFTSTGTPKEGAPWSVKGSYTTIWRNIDGNWKVVQAINTNPLKE